CGKSSFRLHLSALISRSAPSPMFYWAPATRGLTNRCPGLFCGMACRKKTSSPKTTNHPKNQRCYYYLERPRERLEIDGPGMFYMEPDYGKPRTEAQEIKAAAKAAKLFRKHSGSSVRSF